MDEYMQIIIDWMKSWLKKIVDAFKTKRYLWCLVVTVAPFAGVWTAAKLFWLAVDLALRFLDRHGEYLLGFLGPPVLVVFGLWWLFSRKPAKQPPAVAALNAVTAMKHAKQGRDNLLDIILVVGESLEKQITGTYTIQCPMSKGQLAYPHINRCIKVQNGVASTAVAFPYAGEINAAQFLELFNDRMCQMLNAHELPGRPGPVFTGRDNVPRTSIQAIHAVVVSDRIILEVIRVTEEAVPLLNELDRQGEAEQNDPGQLYDDDL